MSRSVCLVALALLAAGPAAASAKTVAVPGHAALTLTGEHAGDMAGASVAPAGDVNGDGRPDVVVGAPLADPRGVKDAGSAYVVFGSGRRGTLRLGALGSRGFRIDGAVARPRSFHPGSNPATSGAGAVVAGAGDVNGDGLDDVLVTGRLAEPGLLQQPGVVFVVFGRRATSPVDLGALGPGGYAIRGDDDFVTVLAGHGAGDVNGDGRDDVGVALAIDSDEDAGTVAIVFGKADGATVDVSAGRFDAPAWGIRAVGGRSSLLLGSSDGMGSAVAGAGDVNGDGLGDVLLGAAGAGSGNAYGLGSVFVLYGRRTAGQVVLRPGRLARGDGFEVRAPRGTRGFGAAVARIGRDFVAGAPGDIVLGRTKGRGAAYAVRDHGRTAYRLAGPLAGGPIGFQLAVPGDVSGDGRADVLAVGRGHRSAPAPALLLSATGGRLVTYTGLRNGPEARAAASGVGGSLFGDRRPDLLLGSPGANAAYVVPG